jgi:uncharacterized protein (UPF0332 family)
MTQAGPAGYMRKALRSLETARWLLSKSDTEGACNRAYYAMFHAAHAALWAAGAQARGVVIETHDGLIALFGQELVKTGMIDAAHGRAFGLVQRTRLLADYTTDPPGDAEARAAVAHAEAFVAAIQLRFPLT